jgi:trehalose 6-phosphate phosphatase
MAPQDRLERFVAARDDGSPAGILLDVDGTLSPIVARPDLARLAPGAREVLAGLVPAFTVVAAISGRTDRELAALVGVPGVRLVGHYGMPAASDVPPDAFDAVERAAATVPGAWVEPKGASVAVHLRAVPDPDAAERTLREPLAAIGREAGLRLIDGKRVLELVPEGASLKGAAVDRVIAASGLGAALYAGDDVADLEAFAALERARSAGAATVAVAVRGPETPSDLTASADVIVEGPDALVALLGRLIPPREDLERPSSGPD